MAATATSETWDAAWTLTARANRKRLTDNIFDSFPTLDAFRRRGMETETGGKEIKESLMYAGNTGQWMDGYDTLNTDAVDGITAAFYPWRYIVVPITISFTEEKENRKREDAMSMLAAKTEQSMMTARDSINAAIFGAQTGKAMLGFQDIIADAPTTGTVGGINRANESWWRNQADTTATTFTTQTTTNIFDGVTRWLAVWDSCSEGNQKPTHLFSTPSISQAYRTALSSQGYARLQLNDPSTMGLNTGGGVGAGAEGTPFEGVNLVADRDCTALHTYFVNMRFMKMKIQAGLNFSKTPFQSGVNQLAQVAYIVVGIQLVTNNARRQGVATAITGV